MRLGSLLGVVPFPICSSEEKGQQGGAHMYAIQVQFLDKGLV